MKKYLKILKKYPPTPLINPKTWGLLTNKKSLRKNNKKKATISFQNTPDKFYFLLFGMIKKQLSSDYDIQAEIITVRSINGAIGTNWIASLKRSYLPNRLFSSQWERAYGQEGYNVAYRSVSLNPITNIRNRQLSSSLWKKIKLEKKLSSLKVNNIEIGDLIIDSYLRFKPSPEFNINDPFVEKIIFQAICDTQKAHSFFSNKKPLFYLSSYSTYIEHGIPVRVALNNNIPVWTFGDIVRFSKRLSKEDHFHTTDTRNYKSKFQKLKDQENLLIEAEKKLEARISGKIDPALAYMTQSAYKRPAIPLPKELKGSVVVFLHDFYDSYNAYDDLIFTDFWEWICFTIEVLTASTFSFYLKPHPNQISLSDKAIEKLNNKYRNIKWLPIEVNNLHLVKAGIVSGVTAYGTVAHELAYMGIPTIGYGRHPHASFDFCRTASSQEEYANMLKSASYLPIDKNQMRRQSLSFYYMHNLYGSKQELELRNSFAKLMRLCHIDKEKDDKVIIGALNNLCTQDGFASFLNTLFKKTYN